MRWRNSFCATTKRALAARALIDQDLERLANLMLSNSGVRAFLFVVSESHRPDRFVTPDGLARPGEQKIDGINAHYLVRRICKATATFSGRESAHYACVIEVFAD